MESRARGLAKAPDVCHFDNQLSESKKKHDLQPGILRGAVAHQTRHAVEIGVVAGQIR